MGAIARVGVFVKCGRGKAQEFFFETDPHPMQALRKRRARYKRRQEKFPTQKFRVAVRKAASEGFRPLI
jgi:hypothetical protein